MMTSYFGALRKLPADLCPISIARYSPRWFRGKRYLALAPKSNAVKRAYFAAAADAAETAREPVPLHLRNAVTPLLKAVGYRQGYRYVHDDPDAREEMTCLPERFQHRDYLRGENANSGPTTTETGRQGRSKGPW